MSAPVFRCEKCQKVTATPNWSDDSERSLRYDYEGYPIDDGGLVRFTPLCECGGRCKPFTDSH